MAANPEERDSDRAKWAIAITALLHSPSIAAAAKVCQIDESTLRRWQRKPKFQALLRSARQQVIDAALGRLVTLAARAVETIERQLTCGIPAVELRAGALVLSTLRDVSLGDLLTRMEALVAEAAEAKNARGSGA